MGILEAPALKLPAINIGNRQKGREHAENVLFVPHVVEEIVEGVEKALHDEAFRENVAGCRNPFGDGRAGPRIAAVLAETAVDEKLLVKEWTF